MQGELHCKSYCMLCMGEVLPGCLQRQTQEMELHCWKVRTEKELDTWHWPMTDLPLFGCQWVNQGSNFHIHEYIDIQIDQEK